MKSEVTNAERVEEAAVILRNRAENGEDLQEAMTDLLANLMHFAAKTKDVHFGNALAMATSHFEAERRGED